ncbi:unnamed protein product [Trypanosoma congolense IL3000]|uniref:WGS project CAEQ00000000 data, annotated contig 1134 n=1 Tax=Trypanosoma congolense (strain IL3000) TaxID=1068625 RepID=F9W410_TRYCI|nr:unnamed protein product [Trypanosoma congolense IL3000]
MNAQTQKPLLLLYCLISSVMGYDVDLASLCAVKHRTAITLGTMIEHYVAAGKSAWRDFMLAASLWSQRSCLLSLRGHVFSVDRPSVVEIVTGAYDPRKKCNRYSAHCACLHFQTAQGPLVYRTHVVGSLCYAIHACYSVQALMPSALNQRG